MKRFLSLILIFVIMLLITGCGKKEEEVNRYFVSFDSDGGTTVKRQVVIEGDHASIPLEPTKVNYSFAGWYLNDILYNFNEPVTRNIKLTAHWNEIINICSNVCKTGYKHDDDCKCIKDNTTTKTNNTTKKTTTVKKTTLYLNESNVTIVKGKKIYMPSYSNETIKWSSSDESIAEVNNGYILGKRSGIATITATAKNVSATINVRVISEDRERLEALVSIMLPKVIKYKNTSLLYTFNGCEVINSANVTELSGIKIENGIVTILDKKIEGTLISGYQITCGSETESITVEHIVNSI